MGMLHFAPVLVLGFVACWLLWPIIVEPSFRRWRAIRRPRAESADRIAEGLFGTWSKHGNTTGLIEPLRRS